MHLQHLCDCSPLSQRGARERASRLASTIEVQRRELEAMRAALPADQPEVVGAVLRLLTPLSHMLAAASHVFEAEGGRL